MAYKKGYKKDDSEVRDYQQELTDKFIANIEEAISKGKGSNWEKPWFTVNEIPYNLSTGEKYTGMNIAILASSKYNDPRYMTFNQMKEYAEKNDLELKLAPGSKAEYIVRVVPLYERDENGKVVKGEDGNQVPLCDENGREKVAYKYMPVFNCSNIQGLPEYKLPEPKSDFQVAQEITDLTDALEDKTGLKLVHSNQGRAYYSVAEHKVHMPNKELFSSEQGYYSTLLHELGHSTGPALNRDLSGAFASKQYSKEELTAEITAAFTALELGLQRKIGEDALSKSHENTKEYLQSWVSALKNDTTLIAQASNQASKATSYQMEKLKEYKNDLQQEVNRLSSKKQSQKQEDKLSLGKSL